MGAEAFGQRGQLQQLPLVNFLGVHCGHGEGALGQGAGLVKDHNARLGQRLQIVAALDQNAVLGGAADAAEEGQGNGDHQGAGAGDHQEDQGPLHPHHPLAFGQSGQKAKTQGVIRQLAHRGQDRQSQRREHHRRGIVPGKFGDEVFRLGLFGGGVLHQVQNFGHRGLPEGLAHRNAQHAGQVDAAADDLVPVPHIPGQGFAGEGGGVQGGRPLQHGPVQRDPLPRLYHDDVAHGHLLRVHLDQLAVPLDVGVVRTDVHQGGDGLAAAVHGHALKQLAHLIEEHDGHALPVLAAAEGAHRCHRHQEVFIKHLAVFDVAHRAPQHIPADNQIGDEVEQRRQPAGSVPGHSPVLRYSGRGQGQPGQPVRQQPVRLRQQNPQAGHQRRADENASEHFLLLSSHTILLLPIGREG